MKILSVDDSNTIRRTIRQIIEVIGAEFLEATNGKEALDVLGSLGGTINLILLDWEMPVMDGFECLKAIKRDERFKSIPVIMLTAVTHKENVIDAIRAGAKQYITKPFSGEDLLSKIVQTLGLDLEDL